jgi:fatty-acyl-CoA synthase
MILPRAVRGPVLFDLIERHRAEYVVGAPITMTTMLAYENKFKFSHAVKMMTAGSPPPPVVMQRFRDEIGMYSCIHEIIHTYIEKDGQTNRLHLCL